MNQEMGTKCVCADGENPYQTPTAAIIEAQEKKTRIGVLHGQIKRLRINGRYVHAPAFGRVGLGLLKLDELAEVGVVERVGLAHVAAGVELTASLPPSAQSTKGRWLRPLP